MREFDPAAVRMGELAYGEDDDKLRDEENAEREDGDDEDVPAAPDGVLAAFGGGSCRRDRGRRK